MMNVAKYAASGTTHSSGMGAMSWLMWCVIATRSVEAQAAAATHSTTSRARGRWPTHGVRDAAGWRGMASRLLIAATVMQRTTNAT